MGLRLGALLWATTAVALLGTVRVGALAWATVVVASLLLLSLLAWRRRSLLRPALAVAAVLVAASAVVAWRVVPLTSSPLGPLGGTRATLDVALIATGDPSTRSGRTSGSRRTDDEWQLDAALLSLRTSDGATEVVDLPVRVLTSADVGAVLPGTLLTGTARVLPADPLRGRAATLIVRDLAVRAGPPAVQGVAGALRSSLRASVAQRPRDEAGLLPGLVVGDTSGVPDDLDRAMRDSGLAHLTAVSGGNVAVVVLLALAVVRGAGVRRGRLQVVLVAAVVAAYVVVARPEPSVVRAAGMTAVVLGALLLDVRVRAIDALGIAVGALVLLDPFLALSVGFAMSTAATAGLLLLAGRWRPRTEGPWPVRAWRAVVALLAVSAVAQLAVAPLVAGIGGGVPLGGLVANLLAEPAVGPATVCGIAAALVGTVAPPLAAVIALPGAWSVGWIARVARATADSSPPLPWPSGWWGALTLLAVLLVGALGAVAARRAGPRVARTCAAVALVGGALVAAPPTALPRAEVWPPAGWRIVMCDVGQGDATVLATGPGEAVVVDVGPDAVLLDRCLRRLGVLRVPLLVLTHFHADHVEGLPGLLRGRTVGTALVSPLGEPPGEAGRVRRWLRDAGVQLRVAAPGDRWQVGPLSLRVLWPLRLLLGQGSDPNNASVVVRADLGETSVLLCGDLETAAQEAVLEAGEVGPVDVVKVPHHGSAKQAPGWATTTRPRVALIGVGVDNDYGHPSARTVADYRAVGSVVGRTDVDGDLAVVPLDDRDGLGLVRRGR
ncbi:MAG TPA: DNA internalization-related competence protein ComEC/Rec2 [Candidatus Nanopelagicales bacterium]|nr:DNA internalization-related competence protein ComEC/Rec2 [Candidatus Nanopelagicales bacterium]